MKINTMNLRTIGITVFVIMVLCVLSSCQTYEEKTISKLTNLSERIEKEGKNFDADDWEEAIEELADIHENMVDCEFTKEQLKEVGRTYGRLSAIITKESAKAFGDGISDAVSRLSSFAKGYTEGVVENLNEEDINDVEDQIMSTLKEIEDVWK